MKQCPSALARDNWFLHEIDPSVGEHLASCPTCKAMTAEQKQVQADFRSSQMMALIARVEQSSRKKVPSPFKGWRLLWFAVPVLTGALVLAAPIEWKTSRSSQVDVPGKVASGYVGAKGSPQLDVVIRRNGKVFSLNDSNSVFAQDQLAFVPRGLPEAYRFFSLGTLSAGVYVSLYPGGLEETLLPLPERNEALPGSITLDDSPGEERLFVTFTKRPLSAGWVAKLSRITTTAELRFVNFDKEEAIAGWIVLVKK